jgi:hypothetical protein
VSSGGFGGWAGVERLDRKALGCGGGASRGSRNGRANVARWPFVRRRVTQAREGRANVPRSAMIGCCVTLARVAPGSGAPGRSHDAVEGEEPPAPSRLAHVVPCHAVKRARVGGELALIHVVPPRRRTRRRSRCARPRRANHAAPTPTAPTGARPRSVSSSGMPAIWPTAIKPGPRRGCGPWPRSIGRRCGRGARR